MITLNIPMAPFAAQRPKLGKGHAYTPHRYRKNKEALSLLLKEKWKKPPLTCAVKLVVIFNFARPKTVKRLEHTVKPDSDNLLKSVMDSGNGILWSDDAIIDEVHVFKRYVCQDKPTANILICFEESSPASS